MVETQATEGHLNYQVLDSDQETVHAESARISYPDKAIWLLPSECGKGVSAELEVEPPGRPDERLALNLYLAPCTAVDMKLPRQQSD